MTPVDEGLIHAWLDGQLSHAEAERVEQLVATDAAWGAAAAEARGLIAGASRILGVLDAVPAVRPMASGPDHLRAVPRRPVWQAPWLRAAATVVLVAGVAGVVWRERPAPVQAPPAAHESTVQPPATAAAPVVSGSVGAEKRAETDAVSSKKDASRAGARLDAPAAAAGASVAGAAAATALPSAPAPASEARAAKPVGALSAAAPPPAVDARLVGCWQQVDSGGAAGNGTLATLRFVTSAVNETANQAPVARLQEFAAGGRALADSRSKAVAVTPRRITDATWEVAWMRAGGRTTLSFSVSGDTLRGTTSTSAGAVGDTAARGVPFVAVRTAACPQ